MADSLCVRWELYILRRFFFKVATWMILYYLATQRSEEGKDGDDDSVLAERWSRDILIIPRRTGKNC